MRANRSRDTGPELRLRQALHAAGYRYRVNFPLNASGRRVRPDLVFTRARLAVFIDGCYWHSCPVHGRMPSDPTGYWRAKLKRNVDRDRAVDQVLQAAGWQVLRIWEHEPLKEAVAEVEEALSFVLRLYRVLLVPLKVGHLARSRQRRRSLAGWCRGW